jgi:hypothetical protein
MRRDDIDDFINPGADDKTKLQNGLRPSRNGVVGFSMLPDDIASTSSVFHA